MSADSGDRVAAICEHHLGQFNSEHFEFHIEFMQTNCGHTLAHCTRPTLARGAGGGVEAVGFSEGTHTKA